jgi:hypothetical protein
VRLSALGESVSELLDAFIEQLNAIPGYLMPPSSYVGAGEIPWDGPGLYVYLGSTGVGQPGAPQSQNIPSTKAIFQTIAVYVMIIRPASTFGYGSSEMPMNVSDEQLNAEGIQLITDAGALIQAALNIKKAHQIVSAPQAGFVIGPIIPIGPLGGMAAMRLTLELSVEQS